jgi:hypothetical protein
VLLAALLAERLLRQVVGLRLVRSMGPVKVAFVKMPWLALSVARLGSLWRGLSLARFAGLALLGSALSIGGGRTSFLLTGRRRA